MVRLFEMNLVEYMGKLAVLSTIAMAPSIKDEDNRFIVHAQNVRQGALIVRKCYKALVSWLEGAIREDKKVFKEKSFFKEFQHAYQLALDRAKPQETIDGGYVWKQLFRQVAEETMKCSQDTVYKRMNKISELFEIKKKGRQAYLKPKEIKEV